MHRFPGHVPRRPALALIALLFILAGCGEPVDRLPAGMPGGPHAGTDGTDAGGAAVAAGAVFTAQQAAPFVQLALDCVDQEYPNKIGHTMQSDADEGTPRSLHPAFFGCFDWHSSVHGHWLLARFARLYPGHELSAPARQVLRQHITPDKIHAETAYLLAEGRASWERPYGLAWLLQLAAELEGWAGEDELRVSQPRAVLVPLERACVRRVSDWLPRLSYPIRTGEHSQTAFAFGLMLDYARVVEDREFEELLEATTLRLYGQDRGADLGFEPSGQDFLSPALAEADLLRRVLSPREYASWLSGFLPGIPAHDGPPDGAWLPVAVVSDRADGKLAHLDGLNLSRAWMLQGVAAGLPAPDPRIPHLRAAARAHARAGLAAVTGEHYAGGHWLGTYAMYLGSRRGLDAAAFQPVLLAGQDLRGQTLAVTHGGVGSPPEWSDDCQRAADRAQEVAMATGDALAGALAGTVILEDTPIFNAGTGANIRLDGRTIQMDAALMTSDGRFAAVAVIEQVKNPILVARAVLDTPHRMLAGDGATRFAHAMGFADVIPTCPEAEAKYRRRMGQLLAGQGSGGYQTFDWRRAWNFPGAIPVSVTDYAGPGHPAAGPETGDTVGTVVRSADGRFAVTLSTGGTSITLDGRVGDVPIYGCGSYAGPHGAVACTGHGEEIIKQMMARTVYDFMVEGLKCREAVRRGLERFGDEWSLGLIAVGRDGWAVGANRQMAYGAPRPLVSPPAGE